MYGITTINLSPGGGRLLLAACIVVFAFIPWRHQLRLVNRFEFDCIYASLGRGFFANADPLNRSDVDLE